MKLKNNFMAYAAITLASVIFGFSFLFTKRAISHLEVFQMLGMRFLLASVCMTVLVAVRAAKVKYDRAKIREILTISVFQPLMYFICETFGIKLTSASESGIMIALIPISAAIFSVILLREKVTVRQWAAIFIAVAGVIVITAAKGAAAGISGVLGYLLLLGAVAAAGLYNPLSRRASSHCTPFEITFVMMWVGTLAFNAIGLVLAGSEGRIGSYITDALNFDVLYGILYLGLLSSVVAFFCVNYAFSRLKSSVSASFANLTTVISVMAGVFLNGEKLYWLQLAGAALVLFGIGLVVKNNNGGGIPKEGGSV